MKIAITMNLETKLTRESMRAMIYNMRSVIYPIVAVLAFLTIANSNLSAQCAGEALACNNLVHVSLDTNCIAVITPDVILEDADADTSIYRIEVRDPDGNLIDTIRQDYGGELLEVRAYCTEDPNPNRQIYCWGYVKIEDKIPPVIEVEPCDTAVTCFVFPFDLESNSLVTRVSFSDNGCQKPDSLGITDIQETLFACGDTTKIIERTWTVVDAAGNHASKVQRIYLLRGTLADITFPSDTIVDCLDEADLSVDKLGMPEVRSCENFEVSHEDVEIEVCGAARKILRRWRVTDICTPSDTTVTQVIKIEDNNPPTFDFSEFEIPADRFQAQKRFCLADAIDIPNPIITDCNLAQTTLTAFYQLVDEFGMMRGQRFPAVVNDIETFNLENVPIGEEFRIIFVANDGCGNISRDTSGVLTAIDTEPPNAVCEGTTNITLNQNGMTEIMAESFDDHSFDNCGIVSKQVRRFNETTFRDRITFDCDDVANSPVRVVFRVTDAAGLFSDCVVEVFVQDKRPITLVCDGDRMFDCTATAEQIEQELLEEEPTVSESCGLVSLVLDIPDYTVSECGTASFTVTWTAVDANGLTSTCDRLVTIGDNARATVRRPSRSQFTLTSCNDSREPEDIPESQPEVLNGECEMINVTYEDRIFFGEADACVKVLRKWSILDWCRFNGGAIGSALIDSFTQTIVIADEVPPVFVSNMDDVIIPDNDKDCEELVTLTARATDDCSNEEDIKYTYAIDMMNNGDTDKTGEGNDASGIYPVGTHSIIWMAEDMCGNIAQNQFVFDVRSQKEPIPFLINNVDITLGPDGTNTLNAASLNASSTNGCLPSGELANDEGLTYSFDEAGEMPTRTFDCSDIPNGRGELIELDIWVADSLGNRAKATVVVAVTDTPDANNPEGVCPDAIGNSGISGIVMNEGASGIAQIPVRLKNLSTGGVTEVQTDEYGQYTFESVEQYEDYEITPLFDGFNMVGISTLDIVFIQRHILGLTDLDSPYKMIAADVDGSGNISAIDLVELRNLVLGRRLDFKTDEWKFVAADFQFADGADPYTFDNSVVIDDAEEVEADNDFIGLKTGDVSGDAFEMLATVRSTEKMKISATKKGDVVRYGIHAPELTDFVGMQFAIDIDTDMTILTLGSDQINFGDEHFELTDDQLLVSWTTGQDVSSSEEPILFLEVRVIGDEIPTLQFDNTTLNAEAYTAQLEEYNISFFQDNQLEEVVTSFSLEQNTPNPFSDFTTISFHMERGGSAHLSITDVNGRSVYERTGLYQAGRNTIELTADEITGSGVYYYTVISGNRRETRRMIVLH